MSGDATTDPMAAEFDAMAAWTADAAVALGPDHYVPAGCRGTGHPAAFDWLLHRMDVAAGDVLADVGAGVGGAAAYAAQQRDVHPLLFEPAAGACHAAARLFGHPVAQADANASPLATGAVDRAWSLGVLCTTEDHVRVLRELRRILSSRGRAGLLVFVADRPEPPGEPEGNHFPTLDGLRASLAEAGLDVVDETAESALPQAPRWWSELAGEVADHVRAHHGDDPAWHAAEDESAAVGRLIDAGTVAGQLLVVRPSG